MTVIIRFIIDNRYQSTEGQSLLGYDYRGNLDPNYEEYEKTEDFQVGRQGQIVDYDYDGITSLYRFVYIKKYYMYNK